MTRTKNVAVLGSTGSIGVQTLQVLEEHADRFRLIGLAAGRGGPALQEQIDRLHPPLVAVADPKGARILTGSGVGDGQTEIGAGPEAVVALACDERVDLVVQGIAGAAGLSSSVAALRAGKTLALANKESMVMAGHLLKRIESEGEGRILPVDSEHSAIFQALSAGRKDAVRRIILTASGGPFFHLGRDELAGVSVQEALEHPNWTMGKKISIDSATMMNKALEVVEARWLFDVDPDQIEVIVHPQSIVHSMVEFVDGTTIAVLGEPDMRGPIQYALTYPERVPSMADPLDFSRMSKLEFFPPDVEKFPALDLGYRVAREGGTSGAVLNAASEVAVDRFLRGLLPFDRIAGFVESALDRHVSIPEPTFEQIIEADHSVRQEFASCSP